MDLVPGNFECLRWCKDTCLPVDSICNGRRDCPTNLDEDCAIFNSEPNVAPGLVADEFFDEGIESLVL